MADAQLPVEFAPLAPYMTAWAGLDEGARAHKRADSTLAELRAFYDTAMPLMPALLTRLQAAPVRDTSPLNLALLGLVLAVVEASFAVEIYGEARPGDVFDVERVKFATQDGVARDER